MSGHIKDGKVRVLSATAREINLKRTCPDANDHIFTVDRDGRKMVGRCPQSGCTWTLTRADEQDKKLIKAIAGEWAPAPGDQPTDWMTGMKIAEDGTFECMSGHIKDGKVRVLSATDREINLKRTCPDANDHIFTVDRDGRKMVGRCPQSRCTWTLTRVDDREKKTQQDNRWWAGSEHEIKIPANRVFDVQWSGVPESTDEVAYRFTAPYKPHEGGRASMASTDYFTLKRKAEDMYQLKHFAANGQVKTVFPLGKVKANAEAVFYIINGWGTVITREAHRYGDSAKFSGLKLNPPPSVVERALRQFLARDSLGAA
jgi:hypothetical protein